MLPVTQVDTFYNGLTLRHRDTINVAAGGTFMKRRPEECYDLIENMTAHHNDWDTLAQRMKEVTPNCETCGGPHSFSDFPSIVGNTQIVYAAIAYQGIKETIILRRTTREETNYSMELTKANDAILKNMQTNMTSLTNSNLELKNMFIQFMKMNTASSSGSRTLPVERETEVAKDMVHPDNNGSTEDVQPLVFLTESPILTSEPVISPIIEPVASPLKLADRSISCPVGVAEDVFVKVGTFHFSVDLIIVDSDADPRIPLILGRSFLKTERALI
nr:reverse transcriptase domain-containing protein [Tanacetum cinerariifolium]